MDTDLAIEMDTAAGEHTTGRLHRHRHRLHWSSTDPRSYRDDRPFPGAIPGEAEIDGGQPRRSTATSCRSTSDSTSLAEEVRPVSTASPSTCWKVGYSSRNDMMCPVPGPHRGCGRGPALAQLVQKTE